MESLGILGFDSVHSAAVDNVPAVRELTRRGLDELIQRCGDEGFGCGNFRALAERQQDTHHHAKSPQG